MKSFIFIISIYVISVITAGCSPSQVNSEQQQILTTTADKVAEWQINNFNYLDSGNLHDYGIDAWTNGVLYMGMARWASISPNGDRYYDWLYNDIGKKNNWQIPANFVDRPIYGIYHADELCMGQFYIKMYEKYKQPEIIQSTVQRLDQIMGNSTDNNMSSRNKKVWSWCDALYMAPPVYAGIALIKNDTSYTEFMHSHFMATYNHLFDKDHHLFYRDDSFFDKREENGEKIFWGRGNGWVIAGLANILQLLPEDAPQRPFYVDLFSLISEQLVELQNPDGYWHASLLDPESYPAPEASATSLIVYALAYGVNNDLLDRVKYMDPLEKGWKHLLSAVDEEGKLGWVQPIGADPRSVTSEMTAPYGVGAFLLAASEIYNINHYIK